jgi:anthranilate phosphoribosyltransferase
MLQSQSWPALLEQLLNGMPLTEEQATALMRGWLDEQIDPVLTGALLAALRAKGVNGVELAAMAQVLREACPLPGARPDLELVDTCGTGGDGADSFNISTAVAFVAAACGAHVAKHRRPVSRFCLPRAGIQPWWAWPPCAAASVYARCSTCSVRS